MILDAESHEILALQGQENVQLDIQNHKPICRWEVMIRISKGRRGETWEDYRACGSCNTPNLDLEVRRGNPNADPRCFRAKSVATPPPMESP